jgi:hypothetical protein
MSVRGEFESWFYASKYAQVAPPTESAKQAAWDGWQASRETLVIKLPDRLPKDGRGDYWDGATNGYNQCIDSCAISIKQSGLKVKP